MIIRVKLWKWRLTFTFAPVSSVVGVNSNLPDGRHVLLWDFDGFPLNQVVIALRRIQSNEMLPTITIYQTSPGDYYCARCLHATNWWDCKRLVADTVGVDESFFRFGVYREHFTLRVGPKHGRYLQLIKVLDSPIPSNVTEADLKSWTVYETLARPHQ